MREYSHPDIDHVFEIDDISMSRISIDGIEVNKNQFHEIAGQYNHGSCSDSKPGNEIALMTILYKVLEINQHKR